MSGASQSREYGIVAEDDGLKYVKLQYSVNDLATVHVNNLMGQGLKTCFQEITSQSQTKSCVVQIDAVVVGTPVIRALLELYQLIRANGGCLICVGYPPRYISMLNTLGVQRLSHFRLASDLAAAKAQIALEPI